MTTTTKRTKKEIVESIKEAFATGNGRRGMMIVHMYREMFNYLSKHVSPYKEYKEIDLVDEIELMYYNKNTELGDECLQTLLDAISKKAEAIDMLESSNYDLSKTIYRMEKKLTEAE